MTTDTAPLRTLQTIAAALIGGVVTLTVVAFLVRPSFGVTVPTVAWVAAAVAPCAVVAAMAAGRAQATGAGRFEPPPVPRTPAPAVPAAPTIVRLAVLEGAALLNAVAYLVAGRGWSLAIVAALVLVMLALFPRG